MGTAVRSSVIPGCRDAAKVEVNVLAADLELC
jgi:hypothetical protein